MKNKRKYEVLTMNVTFLLHLESISKNFQKQKR